MADKLPTMTFKTFKQLIHASNEATWRPIIYKDSATGSEALLIENATDDDPVYIGVTGQFSNPLALQLWRPQQSHQLHANAENITNVVSHCGDDGGSAKSQSIGAAGDEDQTTLAKSQSTGRQNLPNNQELKPRRSHRLTKANSSGRINRSQQGDKVKPTSNEAVLDLRSSSSDDEIESNSNRNLASNRVRTKSKINQQQLWQAFKHFIASCVIGNTELGIAFSAAYAELPSNMGPVAQIEQMTVRASLFTLAICINFC